MRRNPSISIGRPACGVPLGWLLIAIFLFAGESFAFDLSELEALAKKRAEEPYQPGEPIPDYMRNLGYGAWQGIRFDPDRSLWREAASNFQVRMLPAGSFYQQRVRLNVVDSRGIHPVDFDKSLFLFADPAVEKEMPADLGYTGFQLTFPAKGAQESDPFLTFAGGSYFQAMGRNQVMGTFSRGIAIDTGLARGEEFPAFVEFWLERPSAQSTTMRLFGLLDGNSLTGAYEFVVTPGDTTRIAVRARLFLRSQPQVTGVAPLTGMFLYGENTARPAGHWRPRVHDANGLLIHDGASGEWLWRPLINPIHLLTSHLQVEKLRGFGLMQRNRSFDDFQDLDARYERHPSTWVAPRGEWGKGHVSLIQLPAPNDTNRNIVAFFVADRKTQPGEKLAYDYDIYFGDQRVAREPLAHAVNTFVGDARRINGDSEPGTYHIAINFAGDNLAKLKRNAAVVGRITALEEGRVLRQYVEYIPHLKGWRLSMEVKPAAGRPLALRAYLSRDDETLSETWTYYLPPENDILQAGQ